MMMMIMVEVCAWLPIIDVDDDFGNDDDDDDDNDDGAALYWY